MPKVFASSAINVFIFYLEGGLENRLKSTETRERSLYITSFQLGMKVQKQRREERTQEDYPTSAMFL